MRKPLIVVLSVFVGLVVLAVVLAARTSSQEEMNAIIAKEYPQARIISILPRGDMIETYHICDGETIRILSVRTWPLHAVGIQVTETPTPLVSCKVEAE